MKNFRQNALKVAVMIALFSPAAFADGEMGGGGLSDAGNGTRTGKPVVTRTTEDGEMGGGGLAYLESVISSVWDYFDWAR